MTAANLDAQDLRDVATGGQINEDVLQKIFDISHIPLPFTESIGSGTAKNQYSEWTMDKLGDPALGGFVIDGADSDQNDSATGTRVGNHCGILTREIQVSTRADAVDTIGFANATAYQVMMRQKELRRNVEANMLNINGSVTAEEAVAGVPAGFGAMATQYDTGSGATGGGFSAGGWTAVTPGTKVALTEDMIRNACAAAWQDGGNPSKLMSVPAVIKLLSEYMFSSSARIATLTGETNNKGPATAMGSVNVFLTDFGVTLDMVANRIQQAYADVVDATIDSAAVYIYDPAYVEQAMLKGYNVEPLAKTGLSSKRLMSVDFTLKTLEPDAHRVLLDIDIAAPVTASAP